MNLERAMNQSGEYFIAVIDPSGTLLALEARNLSFSSHLLLLGLDSIGERELMMSFVDSLRRTSRV